MDRTEQQLLDALRNHPNDRATREVYADWLEEHGFPERAAFLREEDAAPHELDEVLPDRLLHMAPKADAKWRAITSRAPIGKCVTFALACPKKWDSLMPVSDGVRHCKQCDQQVYFVTTVEEAHQRGAARQCIAIDAGLARNAATTAYEAMAMPQPTMGMVAVPPQPPIRPMGNPPGPRPPVEEKRGVFGRIAGWFKK